jgi:hypothetical protein
VSSIQRKALILKLTIYVTAIFGAYYFGTSLVPEAKTYRLLADVLNDFAISLDVLSPFFNTLNSNASLPHGTGSVIRLTALCVGACCRALCGIAAGGSKAALTLHFASGGDIHGDVGDLSAKDGSKETVLALLGTLVMSSFIRFDHAVSERPSQCGTMVIPYLNTPTSTYLALTVLLVAHLSANWMAVSGVCLRSLNRRRVALLWHARFDASHLSPASISSHEGIFFRSNVVSECSSSGGSVIRCHIVTSSSSLKSWCALSTPAGSHGERQDIVRLDDAVILHIAAMLTSEKFMLWVPNLSRQPIKQVSCICITLRPGYSNADILKAWLVATEFARMKTLSVHSAVSAARGLEDAYEEVSKSMSGFLQELKGYGWDMDSGLLVPGTPLPLHLNIEDTTDTADGLLETKKIR